MARSPVLLAPLCCLAAGVVIFRLAAGALRGAERRRPPGTGARASGVRRPCPVAGATVAGDRVRGDQRWPWGFALAYRATLLRGTADQAANHVPLDATVSPASNFTTPLEVASLARWQALSGGEVLPVRHTLGTYTSGTGAVTEPALGVPARALTQIHGWRASDGTAPLATLARRLYRRGRLRNPGPILRHGARSLSLRIGPSAITVTVTADLRSDSDLVRQLPLGQSGSTTLPRSRAKLLRDAGSSRRSSSTSRPDCRPPSATRSPRTRPPPPNSPRRLHSARFRR